MLREIEIGTIWYIIFVFLFILICIWRYYSQRKIILVEWIERVKTKINNMTEDEILEIYKLEGDIIRLGETDRIKQGFLSILEGFKPCPHCGEVHGSKTNKT